jgi:HAMP domain-containing protein
VPEAGKIVGVENGACTQTCHGAVKGAGDYWGVMWSADSKSRTHAVFPVTDAGGKSIGVVYSIEDISASADAAKTSMLRTLAVFGLTLLIATFAIGGMLDVWVFRRLAAMITTMEDLSVRVAGGDFSVHFEPSGASDEIGRFEQFFARFLDLVSATLKSVLGG